MPWDRRQDQSSIALLLRQKFEELAQAQGFVLGDIEGAPGRKCAMKEGENGGYYILAVDVAKWKPIVVWDQQRTAIPKPPKIPLDAMEVVAFAVDHGQPQCIYGKIALCGLGKDIFRSALVNAISPVLVIKPAFARWFCNEGSGIVLFAKWARKVLTYEIDLPCAYENVTAHSPAKQAHSRLGITPVVQRSVDHCLELAPVNCAFQTGDN